MTSPQAFDGLRARGLRRAPARTAPSARPITASRPRRCTSPSTTRSPRARWRRSRRTAASSASPATAAGTSGRASCTSSAPSSGLTQPGMTIVCGDSHTATHGAFGALAFGIGTSEVEMVLASQCLLQRRPKTLRVAVDGALPPGVAAKDVILAIIARIGVGGGTGHVIEYTGEAVRAFSMEQRMTLCNMSIEAGARAGLVAPDETTFEYLAGRPVLAGWRTRGTARSRAGGRWRRDAGCGVRPGAVSWRRASIGPMITFGTNPGMGIRDRPAACPGPRSAATRPRRAALRRALEYMQIEPGRPLLGHPIDVVFVGSCTNGRLVGPARGRGGPSRPARRAGRADGRRARLAAGEAGGRGRGPRPRLRGGGRGVARAGLLDVHRDERRPTAARPDGCVDEQPQLRGAAGPGQPDVACQPGHRGRECASPAPWRIPRRLS